MNEKTATKNDGFVRRALIMTGLVLLSIAVVGIFWAAIDVWFAGLIAILLALFLRCLSNHVERWFKIKHPWSLILVIVGLLGLCSLGGWLLTAPISRQFSQLRQELPHALNHLWTQVQESPMGSFIPTQPSQSEIMSVGRTAMPTLASVLKITIATMAGTLVALFVGLYLAFDPLPYTRGLIRLVPVSKRPRAREVLDEIGNTLARWIFGQILSMICVSVLIGVGLYISGIPLSLALAAIAGILDFIPIIGPILAAIPAILLGFTVSPSHALFAVVVFVVANQIEEHFFLPVIHRYAVWLPPAVTLFALALMTELFGILGTLVATPVAAIALVLIKRLYVENVLGDSLASTSLKAD